MKKALFPLAFAAVALTTACSDNEIINQEPATPDSLKEAIEFSMSDPQGATTRSTRAGFATETGLLMHIQSDNKETSATEHKYTRTQAVARVQTGTGATDYSNVEFTSDAFKRYWDDAHGRDSWLSVYAVAVPGYTIGSTDTQLAENKLTTPTGNAIWGTSGAETHTIQWTVKQDGQTSASNAKEDLVYARNIQTDGTDGRYWYKYTNNDGSDVGSWQPGDKSSAEAAKTGATGHGDGRMRFMYSNTADHSSAGKFDRGHLKFNHALTRLTIKLIEGNGFAKTTEATDFNFDSGKSYIQIDDANKKGTLNLVNGTWSIPTGDGTGNVQLTPSTKTTGTDNISYYTFNAQILPDNVWNGGAASPKNVFEFDIDNNHYYVTEAQLYEALKAAKKTGNTGMSADELTAAGINTTAKTVTLKQGVNYNLQITVDKKQIETITAVLAEWSEVFAANENIDNSHITINTHKDANGMTDNSTHQLYLKTEDLGAIFTDESYYNTTNNKGYDYTGTYSKNQTPTVDGGKWKTTWFYEDNKTAYHIRSVNSSAHSSMQSTTSGNTYFTIANGAATADGAYDYHWGAPLKTGLPTVASGTDAGKTQYTYDVENGYKALLYPGVTSVKSGDINITELHMMSNIEVIVRTTTGDNAVALEKTEGETTTQCEVTLTRLYSTGQVDLGIGKVTTTGDATGNSAMDKPAKGTSTGSNVTIDGTSYSTIQTKPFSIAVVPQILYRGSKTTATEIAADDESVFVGITVKTPDNNQYYVVKRLQDIKATSVGTSANQTADAEIKRWYPNHKYIYTITVTKTGIKAITCTLADWSIVTGENINIDLES